MGMYSNISMDEMPEQGSFLNRKVVVSFHYDSRKTIEGVVVRDDVAPRMRGDTAREGITIIRLADGRHVLSTECHFMPLREEPTVEETGDASSSIDDPQSVAYDLANAPFYGIAPVEAVGTTDITCEGNEK